MHAFDRYAPLTPEELGHNRKILEALTADLNRLDRARGLWAELREMVRQTADRPLTDAERLAVYRRVREAGNLLDPVTRYIGAVWRDACSHVAEGCALGERIVTELGLGDKEVAYIRGMAALNEMARVFGPPAGPEAGRKDGAN